MAAIPDDQLYTFADRVKNKVAIITGAANGIGKETALQFAKRGAKVVIGDINAVGGERTVAEIIKAGGEAIFIRCDVSIWEDQVTMFELTMSKFGAVDIVVANAGVGEIGSFATLIFDKSGRPTKPQLTTLEVNLMGVLYTCHLALHYLKSGYIEGSLKSIVLLGSIASWQGLPKGVMYSVSKHAVLGMMRSLYRGFELEGIRMASIHPFFADTGIVPLPAKVLLSGIPRTPVTRIAGAIFFAATDINAETNGSAWLLPDDGPVFRVGQQEFKLGVYKMIDDRRNALFKVAHGVSHYLTIGRDLGKIFGRPLLLLFLAIGVARLALRYREQWP